MPEGKKFLHDNGVYSWTQPNLPLRLYWWFPQVTANGYPNQTLMNEEDGEKNNLWCLRKVRVHCYYIVSTILSIYIKKGSASSVFLTVLLRSCIFEMMDLFLNYTLSLHLLWSV